ncbi:hypothetical protein [Nitrosomonas communis]|uniref:hypothetical protein n=1 Tax=Nitrosomonas communis TaxID=44574 RepID=UPI0011609097|nr:hypothetical protein [Nitrosomonas communis]
MAEPEPLIWRASPILPHVKPRVAAVPTELFLSIAPKPDGCEPEFGKPAEGTQNCPERGPRGSDSGW